jgi:hypothetical protein
MTAFRETDVSEVLTASIIEESPENLKSDRDRNAFSQGSVNGDSCRGHSYLPYISECDEM